MQSAIRRVTLRKALDSVSNLPPVRSLLGYHTSQNLCLDAAFELDQVDPYPLPHDRGLHAGRSAGPHPFGTPNYTPNMRSFATKPEDYDVISLDAALVMIEGYDENGFIANGAHLNGSLMCFGNLATLWDVHSLIDITEDSLSLLLMLKPAPDLLVLGCGSRIEKIDPKIEDWLADHGIALECLDTANAVSTFNILNQEGRKVAAALLPGA